MIDLTKPWPLGLSRQTWMLYLLGFVAVVVLLSQLDIWASRAAIAWAGNWRAPLFTVTADSLSDSVLISTIVLFVFALFISNFLSGLNRLASREIAVLAGYIAAGVGLPGLACNLMKRLIGRGRPGVFDQSGAFSFHSIINDWTYQSFPSGHSTTAISVAFTLGFLMPKLFFWLLAFGILVCISRVPVGMHYPSDVFGGACVGLIGAYLVRSFFASRGWVFKVLPDGHIVPRPLSAARRLFQRACA